MNMIESRYMKRGIATIVLLFHLCWMMGQEAPFFANKQLQYAYHNPGYIPELQYATITTGGRFQWVGLDGAPLSLFISGKYFFLGAHSQVGINMLYDKIGYQYIANPKVDYAFCVPFAPDSYINFGMSVGMMTKGYKESEIDLGYTLNNTPTRNSVLEQLEKGSAPDIDVGVEFLLQNFEFGFAANHLLKGTDNVSMNKIFYGFFNANFQSQEWWRLSPTYAFYLFKGDEGSKNVQKHQIGFDFYYVNDYDSHPRDYFYVGAAYRIPNEAVIRVGYSFEFFSIFYSYDYIFEDLRHDSYGSHEIGLEFRIGQKDRGCYANYGMSNKRYTRYHRM